MDEDSITITYETLYEILRAEKTKDELQELDENFYKNVLIYLKDKTKILQNAAMEENIFATDEAETTRLQISNIRKIIKEIYERREKKIIDIAINKSRTNSDIIDTSNLLSQEQKFFKTITGLLDLFRHGILHQTLLLKELSMDIECEKQEEMQNEVQKETRTEIPKEPSKELQEKPAIENEPNALPAEPSATHSTIEPNTINNDAETSPVQTTTTASNLQSTRPDMEKPSQETPAEQKHCKKIKITKQTEQFVGKELELYGPYNEGEITELPDEIAEILLEKGIATLMN